MNKFIALACLCCLSLALSCKDGPKDTGATEKRAVQPGVVADSLTLPAVGDDLNHFTFSVRVVSDSNTADGEWEIVAAFGPNEARGKMTMPRGGEKMQPALRKGNDPNTIIVGFRNKPDTTFFDYMEVRSTNMATTMRYIKTYMLN